MKKMALFFLAFLINPIIYPAWQSHSSIPDENGPPGGPTFITSAPYYNTDTLARQAYIVTRPILRELENKRDEASTNHLNAQEITRKIDELVRTEEEALRQTQERLTKARALQQMVKKQEHEAHSQWTEANRKLLAEKFRLVG